MGQALVSTCGQPHVSGVRPTGARECDSGKASHFGARSSTYTWLVERKLATILFADLVGSTELGASIDPEYARDLLDRFYDAMAAEIALGGGTVEKFIGDAVVAVFGAPAAQEDHAERALQVALWMQERLEALFGGRLSLRIGVNSGEVAVGRPREGSSFVTGDAVNVAARLEQAAAPGRVLVGERTAALVGDAFDLGTLRSVEAKGKPGGVACAELRGMRAPRRPRGGHGPQATFVGRRHELEWLEDMLARTQTDRRPQLAVVVGDAGMGKTTLVREFRERIPATTPFRLGRCLSYGRSVTYSALADVLREDLGLGHDDPADDVLGRLAGREILGLTLGLDVAGDLDPRAAMLHLQDEWVRLISQLGAGGPAVLVIEDLHWAAGPLIELLQRVLADAQGPILVLATTRPDGVPLPAADTLILERLGVVPQQIAGGDIYPALEKGTIDAAEWVGPYDDEKLGLYKIAKFYYYPGWWEGGPELDLFVNTKAWEALPKDYQSILESACAEANVDMVAKYDALNPAALRRLVAAGVQLRPFPREIMQASHKAATEVYDEFATTNAKFKKIYEPWKKFRDEEILWFRVAEQNFDQFMATASQQSAVPAKKS